MTYTDILSIIKTKITNQDYYIIEDIERLISSGNTGGEIDSMVGKYLRSLEDNNILAYTILKKDIIEYLSELQKRGLYIR